MLDIRSNCLHFSYRNEQMVIEPWGPNAFRVRATKKPQFINNDWALCQRPVSKAVAKLTDDGAVIENGNIHAHVSPRGKITMYNQHGEKILEEYCRNRRDCTDPNCSALELEAREFRPIPGGDYSLTARFESLSPEERLYGMGNISSPI